MKDVFERCFKKMAVQVCTSHNHEFLPVTDSAEGVCKDPGEMGAILEPGDPARPEGVKAGS